MRLEVVYVVAHILVTLAIILAYAYSMKLGAPDETLKLALVAIIGYWFGAMGRDKMKKAGEKQ